MKTFIFSAVCFLAINGVFSNELNKKVFEAALSNIDFNLLPAELVQKLEEKFDSDSQISAFDITAIVNEYADIIFGRLQTYILNHNYNDVTLPDAHLSLKPTGHMDLYNGHLQDLSTISRSEDVVVTYSPDNKKIILGLPIKFDDLKYFYDYHTKALLISIHGGVHGSVENAQVHAQLSFDFHTYQAFLDHYDMKDTGKVTVKFTGNKIIDWLTNAMSKVITTLMGQVVVNVLAKFIRETLRALIDKVNEDINNIIHH